jgi:hypothetical protein
MDDVSKGPDETLGSISDAFPEVSEGARSTGVAASFTTLATLGVAGPCPVGFSKFGSARKIGLSE